MTEQEMAVNNLIYKVRLGSTLYGTLIETSDDDLGGIFIPNKDYVLGLKNCEQVILSEKLSKTIRNQKGDTDYTVYSLIKFIQLAIGNNPNIIEFLYIPKQFVLFKNKYMNRLIENRDLFLSKKAYYTFKGYAYAQRKKLELKKENMTGRTELCNKFGYDVKFASHLIRLLTEGLEILVDKTITFPLLQNNLVRDIKIGRYSLEWVFNKADELEKLIDEAYIKSDLQKCADINKINKLQIELLEDYWRK
jgi:predicted nucleotidyltransferase